MTKTQTIKSLSEQLDKIISNIESNTELDIEKSFTEIEKGIEILNELQKRVNNVENKFIDLKKKIGNN